MTKSNQITLAENIGELNKIKKTLSTETYKFLKNTVFPTLTDNEIVLTLYKAQNLGLNVLNGEVTSYSTTNSKNQRQLVFIAGKDGKARIATATHKVEYVKKEAIYTKDGVRCEAWENGTLWGAMAEVKRTDRNEPFKVTCPFSEYKQDNKQWRDKPDTMIQKVALSQAYTGAFPDLFDGVYDASEMPPKPLTATEKTEGAEVITEGEVLALDGASVDKIQSAKDMKELNEICRVVIAEKGEDFRELVTAEYKLKREQFKNETKETPVEETKQ